MILRVETSCDDTCAAVVDGPRILSNVVSSQGVHAAFGGSTNLLLHIPVRQDASIEEIMEDPVPEVRAASRAAAAWLALPPRSAISPRRLLNPRNSARKPHSRTPLRKFSPINTAIAKTRRT